ncbi:uncharacterized protein EURHEDRAFT_415405 [Aspergillus ruber CBS 135680]|uniref:Uncharacterized protein n=1 Tax=Aspergillus ruber (strain CBS 135680) TaxID=1388766 RepID=A0A017S8Y8_ASPRC|nr:uncharacterized protein EURHEDRAFT_415405 [Aspergillus ruber CBS 135680]EYE92625.1 hypothetical protein EURHEDRAFT_415405 [Aspergillus ruber CBS 135680]
MVKKRRGMLEIFVLHTHTGYAALQHKAMLFTACKCMLHAECRTLCSHEYECKIITST